VRPVRCGLAWGYDLAFFKKRKGRLNLALQGGGAHGAFTWGVLDRLLQDPSIEFGWISATSAGAVNAVAVAAGLAEGGPEGARRKLRDVWDAVQKAGVPDLLRLNPFLAGMSRSGTLAQMATLFSPYDFNPLGFDPLRKLLETHIDFSTLRTTQGPELLIAATDIATGQVRHFRRREMTVEAVLASACLPTIHHAVEIDGRAYWDGGFSANPDFLTLARESPAGDTLIVQLDTLTKHSRPTSAREIAGHINHLTFNQPYLAQIAQLELALDTPISWFRTPGDVTRRIAKHRFHLIEAGRFTGNLGADTKGKPEQALLTYLFSAGVSETGKWLDRHRGDIGLRDTAELVRRYKTARNVRPAESTETATGTVTGTADAA
jgi:NTE family protein